MTDLKISMENQAVGSFGAKPTKFRAQTSIQSQAFTEAELAAASAGLQGISAAEEAVAGLLQRAMVLAEIKGSPNAREYFNVNELQMIARDLVLCGESFYVKDAGFLRWYQDFEIVGRNYMVGPGTDAKVLDRSLVFHPRYITDRLTGRGESAMASAKQLKQTALQTGGVIENESRARSAIVLPAPYTNTVGNDAKTNFETSIEKARGNVVAVDKMGSASGNGGVSLYRPIRIGMDTPAHVLAAYETMYQHSLNAMGVVSLFTDGNDKREGIRLALHTFIKPYAKIH